MADYELEVGLSRRPEGQYDAWVRVSQTGFIDKIPVRGDATIDLTALRALHADPAKYGAELSRRLFASTEVRVEFEKACAIADVGDAKVRFRLFVDRSASELHEVRWETLSDPRDAALGRWLASSPNILLSRFVGTDLRPVRLRARSVLRALVVIANPEDLSQGKWSPRGRALAPILGAEELARARAGLKDAVIEELVSDPANGLRVTLEQLELKLRSKPGFDILYLVCHGAFTQEQAGGRQEPFLWLERAAGGADVVAGINLVDRLYDLPHQPRLVVLASCQSAGKGAPAIEDEGAMSALGPRIAEVGVPAVLAMQGNVAMTTLGKFMPAFFSSLKGDGMVDVAMSAGRAAIRDEHDRWAPTLYLRLRSGCIWNRPGKSRHEFTGWDALITRINKVTPILGPGFLEPYLEPIRDVSLELARAYKFPMSPYHREDWPQVVQFIRAHQDHAWPLEKFATHMSRALKSSNKDLPPAGYGKEDDPTALCALLTAVATKRVAEGTIDAHRLLAQLPFTMYLTANPDDLLLDALRKAKRPPEEMVCNWYDAHAKESPEAHLHTVDAPLVYDLFGRFREPDSLVMSEDDYFDYLIRTTRDKRVPSAVTAALTSSMLLFLGFRMDDWSFRVLFRSILNLLGLNPKKYKHIAVQVGPEEGRFIDPEGARTYMEKYFQEHIAERFAGVKFSLFWGTELDFLQELNDRWTVAQKAVSNP